MTSPRARRAFLLFVLLGMAAPFSVEAQPWLPPRGEGSVSLVYQHTYVRDHVFSGGQRLDVGHIRTQGFAVGIEYAPADRLALSASLPYIAARYAGGFAHTHPGGATIDDGTYHGAAQDLRFDARYNLIDGPVAVTPFLGLNMPSHGYEYFAHAAIGVRLREAQMGVHVGGMRGPFYLQGRYAYGVSQRVIGRRRHRSNLDAEIGWVVTPSFRVFAFQLGQMTHGGLEIIPGLLGLTPEERPHHDRLGRANILDVGGGFGVGVTRSMDLTFGAVRNVAGENIHAAQYAFSAGVSWSFGMPSVTGHHSAADPESRSPR